jgi:hypothetical protein
MKIRTALLAGMLSVACLRTAQAQDLHTGLVSYWPFDTTAGTTADTTPDVSLGNNLPLINLTAASLAASSHGSAFQFNGTSQSLGMSHSSNPNDTGLPIYSTNGYTVAFWINGAAQAANKTIFAEGNSGNTGPLFNIATQTGGKLRIFLRNDVNSPLLNNRLSTGIVNDGNWHHVAWVDNNGTATLYIDGNPDGTSFNYVAGAGPTLNNTSIGALLRSPPVNFYTGYIDEVALWKRALSQAEVQSLMTTGISLPITPTPPSITGQPVGRTNAMGDRATFSASVYGNRPMSFQWLLNGAPIADQTNNSITVTSLTTPGTNFYSLLATNVAGSVTSNPAMLVVLPDAAPNVASGLVSYWPFNTISNATTMTTPDLYSHADLVLNSMNSANLVPGEFGNALTFDGSTQYASDTNDTPIYDLSATYTVALWVKGLAQPNVQIFANGNSTSGSYFFIGPDNTGTSGRLDVRVQPGMGDTLSTATVLDGNWHHVVWVDQNGTGLLYIDGVLDQTVYNYTHAALPLNNTTVGALLANPLRDFFAGAVDDVSTWSRRLSYTEIQSIRANSIPAPVATLPPSITQQPTSLTNGIYPGDTVSFTVLATGTAPLSYAWQKGGAPISTAGNPTAATNTLTLANVQPANSGLYSVVITNAGGSITSSIVQLTVIPYTPATNGTVLLVDFDSVSASITQPGFSSMTTAVNPATFNGPKVTLSTIGGTSLSDRVRTTSTNSPPDFNQAAIYNDFIFSTSATDGTGMRILIERLAPDTAYGVTLWAFDSGNGGSRISDWTETSSGTPITVQTGYTFNGSILPAHDYDDTLGALLTSSPTGTLQIEGVKNGGAGVSIFVNAVRLVANPVIRITNVQLVAGALQLTIETQYPNQTIEVQESPDLSPGSWFTASDQILIAPHGSVVIMQFPLNSNQLFYRVVSP